MHEKQMTKLNVPSKLAIGFNNRTDTYSGKLAYVTYFRKEAIAKETSWENWRDKKIDPVYTDNVPTEGFVLNKHVGGCKSWWNFRQSYCRIWDPRGFEFEITIQNLLYILENSNCLKGKGLEGKFVYAWDGADLVLLPVDTEEYRQSVALQEATVEIKGKDGEIGYAYRSKDDKVLYYIGKMYVPKLVDGTVRCVIPRSWSWGRDETIYNQVIAYERLHCFVDEEKNRVYWYPDFKKFYYRTDSHINQLEVNDIIESLKGVSIYADKPGVVRPVSMGLTKLSEHEMDLWNRLAVKKELPKTPEEPFELSEMCRNLYKLYRNGDEYRTVSFGADITVKGRSIWFTEYSAFLEKYADKPDSFYNDNKAYSKEELDKFLMEKPIEVKPSLNSYYHVVDMDGVARLSGKWDNHSASWEKNEKAELEYKRMLDNDELVCFGKNSDRSWYGGGYVVLSDGGWISMEKFTKTGGSAEFNLKKQ